MVFVTRFEDFGCGLHFEERRRKSSEIWAIVSVSIGARYACPARLWALGRPSSFHGNVTKRGLPERRMVVLSETFKTPDAS